MKYALIRGTDMRAGKLVLGTDLFGSDVSQKDAFYLMDMFLDAGGIFLIPRKFMRIGKQKSKAPAKKPSELG